MSDRVSHTIFCTIHGGNPASSQSFSVKIDENETVGELKDYILQKKPKSLANVEADELILYKINAFGDTTEERNKSLQKEILRVHELRGDGELDICETISSVFLGGSPPPKTYHILAVLPQAFIPAVLDEVLPKGLNRVAAEPLEHDILSKRLKSARSRSPPIPRILHCITPTLSQEDLDIVMPLSVREAKDVVGKLLKLWGKPPEVEDEMKFLSHFSKPLSEEEKIPVSQKTFNAWIGNSSSPITMRLDSDDLGTIWRISSDQRAPILKRRTIESVLNNVPPHGGSENAFIPFWQYLIGATLNALQPGDYVRDSDRNTSTGLQRPNYGFCIRGHCIFRGEERAAGSRIDPKNELLEKLIWTYEPLPFILGYAAIGPQVDLVMITAPPSKVTVLASHDLTTAKERIACFVHIVRISSVLGALASRLAHREVMEFKPIIRLNGTVIEVGRNKVKKTFKENSDQHLQHHQRIYSMLDKKKVPNMDKLHSIHPNEGYILTTPVGDSQPPETGKAAYTAIVCVLESLKEMHATPGPVYHRDIRRENIMRKIDSDRWFVIDFADVSQEPTKAACHLSPENHSPHVFHDGHGAEVDIWGVAHYMCQLLAVVQDRQRVEQMANRWKGDTRLTSRMALDEIKQNKHLFFTEVGTAERVKRGTGRGKNLRK